MSTLDNILQNRSNQIMRMENRGTLVKSTFRQIGDIVEKNKKNNLELAPQQLKIDKDKVDGIYECYKRNPWFFLSKCTLTIAYHMDDNKNKYFLLDGQHRLKAIKRLMDDGFTDDYVQISFQKVDSYKEMHELFCELNKDSTHNSETIKSSMRNIMKMRDLKENMKKKWDKYARNPEIERTSRNHFYSLQEFITFLKECGYFDKFLDEDSSDNDLFGVKDKSEQKYLEKIKSETYKIITHIEKKHAEFFTEAKYLENVINKKKYFTDEINMLETHKNMMFSINNNFIKFLIDSDTPVHNYRTNKMTISNEDKKIIWNKEFGDHVYKKCPIFNCNAKLYRNILYGFECGRKKSLKNGGNDDISNLKPICTTCKNKMGEKNWKDYDMKCKRNKLWEDYGSSKKCQHKSCKKTITNENFEIIQKKNTEEYELVCSSCKTIYDESKSEEYSDEDNISESDSSDESDDDSDSFHSCCEEIKPSKKSLHK